MNLFVAKLSPSTTGDDLEKLFSTFGEVASAKVIIDRETQNSKGYGFVEMPNDEEAEKAIADLNESELDGNQIVVKQANPQGSRPSRNFNQRGGGGGFNRGGGGGGYQRRDDRRGGGGYQRRDDRRGGGGYDNNDRW
jgi:RNA recognition motif-containing protein